MVEDVFKNIQVLKGIPVSEIQPNVPIDAGKFASLPRRLRLRNQRHASRER